MLITVQQLRAICRILPEPQANLVAAAINKVCPLYGMNVDILHEFLANVAHESKEFTDYEEDLNYSAKRLTEVWPNRFPTIASAAPFVGHPMAIANKAYGGRMGNIHPGDGYTFRGTGPIMMTGRDMFIRFAQWMRKQFGLFKIAQEWAQLIRTDHEMALHSACWIFSIAKGLNDEAISDDMRTIVKKINGGYLGENDRTRYYELCKKWIPL